MLVVNSGGQNLGVIDAQERQDKTKKYKKRSERENQI